MRHLFLPAEVVNVIESNKRHSAVGFSWPSRTLAHSSQALLSITPNYQCFRAGGSIRATRPHQVNVRRDLVPPSDLRPPPPPTSYIYLIDPIALCPPAPRAGENFRNKQHRHHGRSVARSVLGGRCRSVNRERQPVRAKFSGAYTIRRA